ncbi:Type IV leader peptidase family protein [Vibrio aerogenes CECT 7868]|uniref:Type IV leader peptidase family protein n=1 Tax=Vibrio aerogenes CECT 7868 TaxID=1216006 RepID=A0A1M5ZS39_9VIBR|nr:A24 family peptidase [Vibrio aerogenes]SHI26743.1 Type IV leader peptidase family protein [Vibrio aerogenes CECT 7868]
MFILNWPLAGWLSLAGLSLIVCFYDLRERIIPNSVCLIIFTIALMISPVSVTVVWAAQVTGVVCLLLVFYRYQVWGGGDIKLLLAFLPAISEKFLLLTMTLIGLTGGVLCAFYLVYGAWTDMEQVRKKGLPFGIPVCFACLFGITASLKG